MIREPKAATNASIYPLLLFILLGGSMALWQQRAGGRAWVKTKWKYPFAYGLGFYLGAFELAIFARCS